MTVQSESFWAGAIGIAITQMASLSWEMEGDVPLRVRAGQDLFHSVNLGRGWVNFLSQHLRSW